MPQVSVDIAMSDIDSDDLIEEIKDRMNPKNYNRFKPSEIQQLHKLLSPPQMDNEFSVRNLNDKMKVDHLYKVFDKYSLEQIETLLPE